MVSLEKIATYLFENYFHKKDIDYNTLLLGLKASENKIVYKESDGKIEYIASFLRLTDDTFNNLTKEDITIPKRILNLIKENGNNIHFIQLFFEVNNSKKILQALKEFIDKEKPKTISWFRPDFSKLIKRRF